MNKYRYKAWSGIRAKEAQQIGEELERINVRYNKLTPEIVVKEAKSEKSILHSRFEWNDRKAAAEHRLQQARQIINCCVITEIDSRKVEPIRAFVNYLDGDENVYRPIIDVATNLDVHNQVLARALRELEIWSERYKRFNEFAEVIAAIEVSKGKIEKRNKVA